MAEHGGGPESEQNWSHPTPTTEIETKGRAKQGRGFPGLGLDDMHEWSLI